MQRRQILVLLHVVEVVISRSDCPLQADQGLVQILLLFDQFGFGGLRFVSDDQSAARAEGAGGVVLHSALLLVPRTRRSCLAASAADRPVRIRKYPA